MTYQPKYNFKIKSFGIVLKLRIAVGVGWMFCKMLRNVTIGGWVVDEMLRNSK